MLPQGRGLHARGGDVWREVRRGDGHPSQPVLRHQFLILRRDVPCLTVDFFPSVVKFNQLWMIKVVRLIGCMKQLEVLATGIVLLKYG